MAHTIYYIALNGIYFGGGAVGCAIAGWLADRIGRKKCLQVVALICLMSTLVCTASVHIGMLLVGRIFQGIG